MNSIKIALLGLGTVGSGVWWILNENREDIARKVGKPLEIVKVLVKDKDKSRRVNVPEELITTDFEEIVDDSEINVVVEVMGTIEPAKTYILKSLRKGKNVVTANKDLLALYGKELFDAEAEHGTDLFFEASVAGGIPIIRPLKQCLAANKIQEVMGIINGTTNFILTKMTEHGSDFEKVLAEAQELGFAEADPSSDIDGLDAARKIAILASIAFGTRITVNDVYVEGIRAISPQDIQYAKELGYIIKLLALAREIDDEVEVRVQPAFLPKNHPLANVNNEFNAVFVKGNAVGDTMFYGKGAGELPTASAVVGDIIDVARDLTKEVTGRIGCTCFEDKKIKTIDEFESKYYLRLKVQDKPGVLAAIANVFGNHEVSLATVLQKRTVGTEAEVVLISHSVKSQNMRDALKIIKDLQNVVGIQNVIAVEGGD